LVTGLALLALAPRAHALTFSVADISYDNALLSQFNLVTIGNLTQSSASGAVNTVAGRAIIGGNATFVGANASVCGTNCAGNASLAVDPTGAKFSALTVFGNVVGTSGTSAFTNTTIGAGDVSVRGSTTGNLNLNSNGALRVAGNAAGTKVLDATAIKTTQSSFAGTSSASRSFLGIPYTVAGVAPQVNQTIASVFPFASTYQSEVKQLAQGLATLPGTPGVSAQRMTGGDGVFFTAVNDYTGSNGLKYGVVTTTTADLAGMTNFKGVDNNSNAATFVIVSGDGANYTLPNLNSYAGANKVIFDFVDATTLKFAGNWSGSILAPLANISSMGGALDGSVLVGSINQSQALTAGNLFAGDLTGLIPEPASLAVLGAGLAAAALARRRRPKGHRL